MENPRFSFAIDDILYVIYFWFISLHFLLINNIDFAAMIHFCLLKRAQT